MQIFSSKMCCLKFCVLMKKTTSCGKRIHTSICERSLVLHHPGVAYCHRCHRGILFTENVSHQCVHRSCRKANKKSLGLYDELCSTCFADVRKQVNIRSFNRVRYERTPLAERNAKEKDGILQIVASFSDKLKKTPEYAPQLEQMLVHHVIPELTSPHGFLRARVEFLSVLLHIPGMLHLLAILGHRLHKY